VTTLQNSAESGENNRIYWESMGERFSSIPQIDFSDTIEVGFGNPHTLFGVT
jgi:hypothetical protein